MSRKDRETRCPVEKSIECWSDGFFQAMKEVQVDILQEKIKKSWEPKMDKVADAVLESMGVYWEVTLKHAKSQCDLREKVKNIFCEEK